MSGKKPSSIRDRLREMRISEPQRLSKSGPIFKPPAETLPSAEKEVPPCEAPPSEVPRVEGAQNVESQKEIPQNEVANIEVAQIQIPQSVAAEIESTTREVAHNELPQIKVSRIVSPQPELPRNEVAHDLLPQIEQPRHEGSHREHPQGEAPQSGEIHREQSRSEAPRKKQPKKERHQNEASTPGEVTQIELPQIEQSSKAFFRLSDRAFSYPQLQRLSGDCFRLFLWMSSRGWRFQNSDGTLRASVSFIEDHTAMSHATISRCLKTLREVRLLELLEMDYKRGNVWSVSPIAFAGCEPENLPPRSGGPQNEGPRKEAAVLSKRDPSHLNLREKVPQFEGQIRNIKKFKNLSQEGAQALFARVEKIRAPEKQKTEREGLMQLLETHQSAEIETALAYIERYGTLSGESCHSHFRYLTVAMDDVLQRCRQKGFSLSAVGSTFLTPNRTNDEPDRDSEEQRKRAALAAFQTDLTAEERGKIVADFVTKEFTFGYTPPDSLATTLAAMQWFSTREMSQTALAV